MFLNKFRYKPTKKSSDYRLKITVSLAKYLKKTNPWQRKSSDNKMFT